MKPNIIFIISDQHRWDFNGWSTEKNGNTYTPNLNKLALNGTIFTHAYCNSPLCSPSRAVIASGRYGMNTGCFTNLHELPPNTPSFVTQLRKAGYQTAAIGKTHMEIHAYDSDLCSEKHRQYMNSLGWEYISEISGNGMLKTGIKCAYSEFLRKENMFTDVLEFYRKWHYFMDKSPGFPDFHCELWPFEEKYQETYFVAEEALKFLELRDKTRPFFMHVGFAAPHSPIEANKRFLEFYENEQETPPCGAEANKEIINARKGYRAMITQIDYHIGRIISFLENAGEAENTVIIYTADHGEMAGDFGRTGKTCFYEGSIRVPLIISGPGIKRTACDAFAELIDIGKTVCDIAGVQPHPFDQGKSLYPILQGKKSSHRDTIYAEMGCDKMIFDGKYKLMFGDPGDDLRGLGRIHLDRHPGLPPAPVKLYNLISDPMECFNLAPRDSSDIEEMSLLLEMQKKLLTRINENTFVQPFKDRGVYKPIETSANS